MSYNSFAIKSLLKKEDIVNLLDSLGVHGVNDKDPNGIRCSCPIHSSSGSTVFTYNPDKHLYVCYGECVYEEKEGDIFKLVQLVNKCNYHDAAEYICDVVGIDKNIVQSSEEWLLEELKIKLDNILIEIDLNNHINIQLEWEYGVQPIDEEIGKKFIGLKDEEGYISGLGISDDILTLFESGYDCNDKRWLLPIRSPDGKLLGFDGRDITNKSKSKWKKRKGLLTSKLLGRLDIVKKYILEKDEIVIVEGKKDQMAIFESDIKNVSCTYGSALSDDQKEIIDFLCSKIVVFPDGDSAGYKHVKSITEKCYPEYEILVCETPDGEDPADLTIKIVKELYNNAISVEEWLKKYEYRDKKKKKK